MPEIDLRRNYRTVGRSRDCALPANERVEKPSKYRMIGTNETTAANSRYPRFRAARDW